MKAKRKENGKQETMPKILLLMILADDDHVNSVRLNVPNTILVVFAAPVRMSTHGNIYLKHKDLG